jgi:hypothetical protein
MVLSGSAVKKALPDGVAWVPSGRKVMRKLYVRQGMSLGPGGIPGETRGGASMRTSPLCPGVG